MTIYQKGQPITIVEKPDNWKPRPEFIDTDFYCGTKELRAGMTGKIVAPNGDYVRGCYLIEVEGIDRVLAIYERCFTSEQTTMTKYEAEKLIADGERLLQDASTTYQRLAALESLHDIQQAIQSLDKAIVLWPENTEAVEFREILINTKRC